MLAWLPSLLSLLIGILAQFNAADWVAQHPNIAMALATLGTLITALTRSPVVSSESKRVGTGLNLFIIGALMLWSLCLWVGTVSAFDVTVEGTQVRLTYQEPTQNKTGTSLTDLGKTTGYFALPPDSQPRSCIETVASAPTGGGQVQALCVVPVLLDQEADVRFTATATDLSGNESLHSVPVNRRLDFLAPAAPQ